MGLTAALEARSSTRMCSKQCLGQESEQRGNVFQAVAWSNLSRRGKGGPRGADPQMVSNVVWRLSWDPPPDAVGRRRVRPGGQSGRRGQERTDARSYALQPAGGGPAFKRNWI
ncbi:hypothetical protein GOP47_0000119 [Adiantum capillus-veneris]|uniref:Uncharacterized protein n=1 Tax=Adiantum capillus-veneris TaxID=13818 RepID=A0A9D4ZSS9_ADICA|nr:hypothetical protein GOP47_0000119 [Adiantum capillus-veneris]